eukprot:342375-Pyramimonas_sp.AAC.1
MSGDRLMERPRSSGRRHREHSVELDEETDEGGGSGDPSRALVVASAFRGGDVMLNLNVPPGWAEPAGGKRAFAPTGLG